MKPPTRRELREADETILYLQGIVADLLKVIDYTSGIYNDNYEERAVIIKKAEAVLPPRRRRMNKTILYAFHPEEA